jgi:hypothetical protein
VHSGWAGISSHTEIVVQIAPSTESRVNCGHVTLPHTKTFWKLRGAVSPVTIQGSSE